MRFEPIGPYALTRADLLAASLVISFRAGSRKTKITCFTLTIATSVLFAGAVFTRDYILAGAAAFWLAFIFLIGPVLRPLKDSRDIVLSYDPDGIRADTPKANTLYKWATVERLVRTGPRLFVMINGRCGLVIDERNTTKANINALKKVVGDQMIKTRESRVIGQRP